MKAEILIDGDAARTVEVCECSGGYRMRIQESDTAPSEEVAVDFCVSGGVANVIIDGQSYLVEFSEDDGHYRVAVREHRMEARLRTREDQLRALLHTPLGGGHDFMAAGMPGAVLEVFVAPGDRVADGDKLIILEAMKMENTLRATRAAVIATVDVSEGDHVQTGDTLLTFEVEP